MYRRYWLILVVIALLTPLGLLAEGTAWGEWGTDQLHDLLGFVPQGIQQAAGWWQGIFPDYTVKILGEGRAAERTGYVLSAFLGAGLVYAVMTMYVKFVARTGSK